MLRPTDVENIRGNNTRYAMVIAVSKRARAIATEAEDKNIILTEKPVSMAVRDFASKEFKVVPINYEGTEF